MLTSAVAPRASTAPGAARMSLDVSRLVVPQAFKDDRNDRNPLGSTRVRAELLRIATKDEYELTDLLAYAAANPSLDNRVDGLLGSAQSMPPLEDLSDDEEEPVPLSNDAHFTRVHEQSTVDTEQDATGERALRKIGFSTELWLALAARTASQHAHSFLLVCFTLLALKSGMPTACWSTFGGVLLLYNKTWATEFARDVALRLRTEQLSDKDVSSNVRFVVGDNLDYHTKNVHEHTDRSGEYVKTVNWFSVPLSKSKLGLTDTLHPGGWIREGFRHFSVRPLFDPHHVENASFKKETWCGFMAQASRGDDILRHPDVPKPERSPVLFEQPVLDAGTASYVDVDKWLGAVRRMFIHLLNIVTIRTTRPAAVVLAVGDHQTWSRMLWLKLTYPARYAWLLMLPGEFHFEKHTLMALHVLWWHALIHSVVAELGCFKTIKKDWSSIELCKYYDVFYMLTIVTLVDHLVAVVPPHLLRNPDVLLRKVGDNPAAVRAVRFLFEFALPWLALRQAIRGNLSAVIDVMWRVTYHWFSATGKTNYRIMSVVVTMVTCAMVPELAGVWVLMRTASLCGYPGRNVAWDWVCERYNRMSKQALGTNVTRERLLHYLPILNSFRHIWPRVQRAMGLREAEASDYTHISTGDRETLGRFWKRTLGEDFDALCQPKDVYAFRVEQDEMESGAGRGARGGRGGGRGGRRGDGGRARGRTRDGSKAAAHARLSETDEADVPPDPWTLVLERATGSGRLVPDATEEDDDMEGMEEDTEWEVERILQAKGEGDKRKYYIKWKGYTENTWQSIDDLAGCKELVQSFEAQLKAKRRRVETGAADSSDDEDSDQSDDGDEPQDDYTTKVLPWYKDVSKIIQEHKLKR